MHACVLRFDDGLMVKNATGAGERGNMNGCGPGPEKGLRGRARGGSCCKDVVDEKDIFAKHRRRIRNFEGAANIAAALARSETCLAVGRTESHESGGCERQM